VKQKIAIVGMGYVGTAMRNLFSYGSQFELVTYDKSMLPPRPPETFLEQEEFARARERARQPLRGADLAIVCVPTPMAGNGSADLSAVEEVAGWLPEYAHTILIKSTVPPGTTDRLNQASGGGSAVGPFHFSPEYAGEGKNYVAPWRHPDPRQSLSHDFVIVGGPTPDRVLAFFQRVMATDARYLATSARAAELAKYAENSFLAVKLRFCFELAEIAEAFGVSYNAVRELWLADSRIGRSHTLVYPGQHFFSGKCLPKDLSAFVHAAHAKGVTAPLLSTVNAVNEAARKAAPAVPTHVLERTSLKGEGMPFIGVCTICGAEGLTPAAALEECPGR
jgi:UDPglucose 6-dehydrogenase